MHIHLDFAEMTVVSVGILYFNKIEGKKSIDFFFSCVKQVINPFPILGCNVLLLTVFPTGRGILLSNAIVFATILCAVLLLFIDMLLFLWCIMLIFYYA